jgi:hypothetical protein
MVAKSVLVLEIPHEEWRKSTVKMNFFRLKLPHQPKRALVGQKKRQIKSSRESEA